LLIIGALLAAIPCFLLSGILFGVWADPMDWDDGNWIRFGVGLMLLEFILLHSGAFMAVVLGIKQSLSKRLMVFFGFVLLYGLMIWGVSLALDNSGLMWIFIAVVAGRLTTAFFNREIGIGAILARSTIGIVCYLFVVFATVFVPVPEWGITPQVLEQVYPDRGSGVWEDEPQRAIVGAAVYFLLMGLAELLLLGPNWLGVGMQPPRPRKSQGSES